MKDDARGLYKSIWLMETCENIYIYIYGLLRTLKTRFKIVKTFETRADNIYMMGSNVASILILYVIILL